MKTTPTDVFLSSICVGALVFLAYGTVSLLSFSGRYAAVGDVVVFLLLYGLYTSLLLAGLRSFRPYPVGEFSMDSPQFTYWKLISVLTDLGQKALAPFVTVFTQVAIHWLFGARVGKQIACAGVIRDLPLIWFGDSCTIGQNSVIVGHAITHHSILMKPVTIGANSVVGVHCVVFPGVNLGDRAVLAPGAVALANTVIPPNELWGGIPARKIKTLD